MRTVPFKTVYDAIVRRHGLDPRTAAVTSDGGLAIVERINARLKRGWFYWEAPDITLTEERAFRQIWNASHQYRVIGEGGKPDEVFYLPALLAEEEITYFKIKSDAPGDPPIGTAPPLGGAASDYWEPLNPVDQYIAYDQTCKKPIGDVLGVYSGNPSTCSPSPLNYRPSGRGIEVCGGGRQTVFVRFLMQVERFTTLPYIATKTYQRGELVCDWEKGECYQALTTTVGKNPSTEPSYWRRVLFPEFLAEYVKAGVFADTLRESGADAGALQLALLADAEAEDELIRQINRWQAQGQHYFYIPYGAAARRWIDGHRWYCSPTYVQVNGSSPPITTLTDECEEGGYLPIPPSFPTVGWEYHPEIVSLRGPSLPSLAGLPTTMKATGFLVQIVLTVDGGRQASTWELATGAADPGDLGQVAPSDFNAGTNNKHWVKVAG